MQCENCGKKVYANEVCSCGVRAPKKNSGGVHVNTVICFILLLLAALCLVMTLSLRTVINKNKLVESIEEIKLADIEVDDNKKLDQYIYEEYVDDPRITVENVGNLLEEPFIKDFIIEKIQDIQDFGLGKSDYKYITSDDIVKLIDDNADVLYEEAGLRFLDPDKAELKEELSGLDKFAESDFLNSYFGSALVHTFFSYANVVFLIILMVAIFIQWLVVYKLNDRRISKMLIKYGIATVIPSGIVFVTSVSPIRISNGIKVADNILGSAMLPFILYSAIVLAVGIAFIVIGAVANKKYKNAATSDGTVSNNTYSGTVSTNSAAAPQPAAKPEVKQEVKPTADTEIIPEVKTESKPSVSESKVENKGNTCPQCSHVNKEDAAFCSRCGTKLK